MRIVSAYDAATNAGKDHMAQITNEERERRDGIIDRAERKCRVAFAEALAEFGDAHKFKRAGLVMAILDRAVSRWRLSPRMPH